MWNPKHNGLPEANNYIKEPLRFDKPGGKEGSKKKVAWQINETEPS